jgi:hypothetical protein
MEKSRQRPHEAMDPITTPPVEVDDVTSSGSPPGTARKHPDTYRGPVLHSSQLDHATLELVHDKTVVVVGSGASAVEAVETAFCRGARRCIVLTRKDNVRGHVISCCHPRTPTRRNKKLLARGAPSIFVIVLFDLN